MFLTVCASGGQRSTSSVVPWEPNALFFGSGFLTQELAGSAGLASEPQGSAPLCSPGQDLYAHVPAQLFLNLGFGARTQGHAQPVDSGSSVVGLSLSLPRPTASPSSAGLVTLASHVAI